MPLALALAAAVLAPAQSIFVSAGHDPFEDDDSAAGSVAGTLYTASADHSDADEYFQRAYAAADYRTAKLSAQVDGNGTAHARASLKDTLEIDRADGEGGLGLAYVRVRAHASTNADPADLNPYDYAGAYGSSSAILSLTVGTNAFSWRKDTSAYSLWEQGDPGPSGETYDSTTTELRQILPDGSVGVTSPTSSGGDFLLPIYFSFGASMDLQMEASASAYLYNGGTVDTDFMHTYQWQGIDRVYAFDGDGNRSLVTGYSAWGGSGTDYAAPVPEPASLLALGAGALGLLRRRRTPAR